MSLKWKNERDSGKESNDKVNNHDWLVREEDDSDWVKSKIAQQERNLMIIGRLIFETCYKREGKHIQGNLAMHELLPQKEGVPNQFIL